MWAFLWIRPNPIIAVCVFSYNLQRSVHKKWRIVLTLWAGSHGVPSDRDCRDWPQVTWDLGHVWTSPHSVSIYVVHKCPACGSFSIVLFAEWREFKFLIWLIWRSKFSVKLAAPTIGPQLLIEARTQSVSETCMISSEYVAHLLFCHYITWSTPPFDSLLTWSTTTPLHWHPCSSINDVTNDLKDDEQHHSVEHPPCNSVRVVYNSDVPSNASIHHMCTPQSHLDWHQWCDLPLEPKLELCIKNYANRWYVSHEQRRLSDTKYQVVSTWGSEESRLK